MTAYTMDPDRVELLERRCERLERMIRILQNKSISDAGNIDKLEKTVKYLKVHSQYNDERRAGYSHYEAEKRVRTAFSLSDEEDV